ncbi:hypothetical protein F2Q68_00021023 [Brassica cretica]|uniref:Uncharacterized protein n=1 Tax=Brassica cretica TaxID=69181 RepID=A0A8S9FXB1_BRACR|nr:hypothetical protein F2Q68_00021023 [Brassica cretica]
MAPRLSSSPRRLHLSAFDLAVALLDDSASALLISRWLSSTAPRLPSSPRRLRSSAF